MAMKICMIGNSHIGALKLGWKQIRHSHRHEVSFLGVPGVQIRNLAIEQGTVVPTSDNSRKYFEKTLGAESIELDRYDVVVVVGCGLNLIGALSVTSRWRPYTLVDETARDDQTQFDLVSDRLFAEILSSKIRKSLANRYITKMARQGAARVLYVTTPLPSSEIRLKPQEDPVKDLVAGAHGPAVASLYRDAIEQVMGRDKVVFPPADVLVDGAMTDMRYSRGSLRLDGKREHPEDDMHHMNADYGALVLEAVFSRLAGAAGVR